MDSILWRLARGASLRATEFMIKLALEDFDD